jgi:hypothetical protein
MIFLGLLEELLELERRRVLVRLRVRDCRFVVQE